MSAATTRRARLAVLAALVLAGLGIAGYAMETRAGAEPRPDSVGFGLPWSHELHARHPDFTCQSCHHESRPGASRMKACDANGCHPRGPARDRGARWSDEAPGQRAALHAKCVGCHNAVHEGPVECAGCHAGHRGNELCGGCHRDSLAAYIEAGHGAVPCSACHTRLLDNRATETGAHPRPVPRVSDPASCLSCHGAERDLAGFPASRFEAEGAHAELPDPASSDCQGCHPPHAPGASG